MTEFHTAPFWIGTGLTPGKADKLTTIHHMLRTRNHRTCHPQLVHTFIANALYINLTNTNCNINPIRLSLLFTLQVYVIQFIIKFSFFKVFKFQFLIYSISYSYLYSVSILWIVTINSNMYIYLGVKWFNLHIWLNQMAPLVLSNIK